MTDLRTAAQQALEALESLHKRGVWGDFYGVADTLRAALEQPEQEPVAWMWEHQLEDLKHYGFLPNMRAWTTERRTGNFEKLVPVYTHPPRREWRGLTEEEIATAAPDEPFDLDFAYARAIEAALKEKNQ